MSEEKKNECRISGRIVECPDDPTKDKIDTLREEIEPWLSAVFQSEHISLLVGSGFTVAVAKELGVKATDMSLDFKDIPYSEELNAEAARSADVLGRGAPNIEDKIRAANTLKSGLALLTSNAEAQEKCAQIKKALEDLYTRFHEDILRSERVINAGLMTMEGKETNLSPLSMLTSFLLSFASRSATRERLNIFTTNYDRLIEYGADFCGLHLLDRFVGGLEPIFRSSRLNIDMHYNPPGIRGEPRYLEGVVRLTKLHGSLDWLNENGFIKKIALPFGAPAIPERSRPLGADAIMIYPTSAKDRETAEYPYVELFRDYAAAVCRPNSVLVTYGYGFGDDHINRTIRDMLTIPSTHLVVISKYDSDDRIKNFIHDLGRDSQLTVLLGEHLGDMRTLVEHYLPKPAIDKISLRKTELLKNRGKLTADNAKVEDKTKAEDKK
ncbi:SIR2 family protein [Desulfobaculum senezii]